MSLCVDTASYRDLAAAPATDIGSSYECTASRVVLRSSEYSRHPADSRQRTCERWHKLFMSSLTLWRPLLPYVYCFVLPIVANKDLHMGKPYSILCCHIGLSRHL